MNVLPFILQHSDDVLVAWFASAELTDMEAISWDTEPVFETVGTYYAATYRVTPNDTCFSETRTPFTILENILTAENSGDVTIIEGESVEIWGNGK